MSQLNLQIHGLLGKSTFYAKCLNNIIISPQEKQQQVVCPPCKCIKSKTVLHIIRGGGVGGGPIKFATHFVDGGDCDYPWPLCESPKQQEQQRNY